MLSQNERLFDSMSAGRFPLFLSTQRERKTQERKYNVVFISTWSDLLFLLSSCPDVHHQHHQDQVQPPGQAGALSGHALLGLPHRPQPSLRVPKPLFGRRGRIYTGIGHCSISGEDDGRVGIGEEGI